MIQQLERKISYNGVDLTLFSEWEDLVNLLIYELETDHYRLSNITFEPGDVVVDIGGNIGSVSLYLAKKYPFIKVITIEPVYRTYLTLIQNIWFNEVFNIIPINVAITNDRRQLAMYVDYNQPGAASSFVSLNSRHNIERVNSITFDDLFTIFKLNRIKMLKIDCEGAEYEILYSTDKLKYVDYIRAEFLLNQKLRNE